MTLRIFFRIKIELKFTHSYINRILFVSALKYFLTITTIPPTPESIRFFSEEIYSLAFSRLLQC